jgi:cell division protein FtsB
MKLRRATSGTAKASGRGRRIARDMIAPFAALVVLLSIAAYAMIGPTGILAWIDMRERLGERRVELARLEERRAALRNRVRLLREAEPDPDLASEMVRRDLGVAAPDEIVVPLR